MKKLVLALVVMALLASLGAAQYRNPVFLTGGYGTTSTLYSPGLYVLDANNNTLTSLFPSWLKNYTIYDAKMDVDNKKIVFVAYSTSSTAYNVKDGIFRYDPATQKLTTIYGGVYSAQSLTRYIYKNMINQDGDYVFGARSYLPQTVPTTMTRYDYNVLKYDASSALTTVLTSYMLNPGTGYGGPVKAYFDDAYGVDIDTGDYLINSGYSGNTTSVLGYYPWLRVDPNVAGKWSTFAAGAYQKFYGRITYYGKAQQDYATGDIMSGYSGSLYKQGQGYNIGGFTTLWNFGRPGGWTYRYQAAPDLQSAPMQRWANPMYIQKFRAAPATGYAYTDAFAYLYAPPNAAMAQFVDCDPSFSQVKQYGPNYNYSYSWGFYKSRNIQTVKTAPSKWQVRFSCPDFPSKPYYAVVGGSGIRPGIPLSSGRTIWINFDQLVFLSLNNILLPFWSSGPGVLDANGEAQGFLNVSLLGPLGGYPVHIAMIVMDPTAPDGIAFIPDTYVVKLP